MIAQTWTASFLAELFAGTHVVASDTIKLALYTEDASLGAATTAYTATNEATGSGYVAGGVVVANVVVTAGAAGPYIDFNDVVLTAAVTARGALLYNASKANRSIAVLDFGANKTSTTTFTVTLPGNTPTTALLRLTV